tara:strand:- start:1661 stop:2485 length:825 start_codon:yes stop_codon:yes gene_type:complete
MVNRKWSHWLPNIKKEINETSGIVGLLGVGTGVAGLVIAIPIVVGVGSALLASALGYCVYKGFPERMYKPSELLGQTSPPSILKSLSEHIPAIGIIGASKAGKSTFISHLITTPNPTERTQSVYATIFALQTSPVKYSALLDGDGTQYNQQFKVIDNSSILFVFFDHNASETLNEIDPERIIDHDRFLEQLEGYLKELSNQSSIKLDCIHFVLNKSDSWKENNEEDEQKIISWYENILVNWRRLPYSKNISGSIHSNKNAEDIKSLLNVITGYV